MTDIVGRLRSGADGLWSTNLAHIPEAMTDAADEIERLRKALNDVTNAANDAYQVARDALHDAQTAPSESP